jgi:hypothetical protein
MLLAQAGYKPDNVSGRYTFYKSPLRDEDDASFVVFPDNRWKDFGSDETGSSIDLFCILYNVDPKEAVDRMLGKDYGEVYTHKPTSVKKKPGIEVLGTKELTSATLSAYIKTRKIEPELVKLYCKQVEIRFPEGDHPNKIHNVIGFKNDKGGWEFRNQYLKVGSSPKWYTTIKGNGKECILLEGFFDFFALLMWKGKTRFDQDVFVYNSTSFLDVSVEVLQKYDLVRSFTDNDDTGKKVVRHLKNSGVWIKDYSYLYSNYNDVNEFLMNEL